MKFQLNEMNGKIIGRKPLYVAVAQRKDERKAWLQVTMHRLFFPLYPSSFDLAIDHSFCKLDLVAIV